MIGPTPDGSADWVPSARISERMPVCEPTCGESVPLAEELGAIYRRRNSPADGPEARHRAERSPDVACRRLHRTRARDKPNVGVRTGQPRPRQLWISHFLKLPRASGLNTTWWTRGRGLLSAPFPLVGGGVAVEPQQIKDLAPPTAGIRQLGRASRVDAGRHRVGTYVRIRRANAAILARLSASPPRDT